MRTRAPVALLIAVELALFVFAVLPFLLHNGLTEHDLIGHRAAAQWSADVLWPSPRGWDPRFFCGAPFGVAYPPALAWLAGGLGRLIGVGPALKLWVALAVMATPVSIYAAARALARSGAGAITATLGATLYLAARQAELGGNLRASFETGNLAEAIALPLFFLYLASLPSVLRGRTPRASLLLAAVLLTHLVTGIIALVVLAAAFFAAPARGAVLRHAACAFFLSAFFTLPLVLERGFGAQPLISYDQYPDLAIEGLLSMLLIGVGVLSFLKEGVASDERRVIAAVLGAAAAVFVLRAYVFADPPAGGWHLHRFKLFDQLLLLLLALLFVGDRLADRRGLLGAGAIAVVLIAWACARLPTRGVPAQPFPDLGLRAELTARPGRVLVVASPLHQSSDHVVQHLAAQAGARVGKGLFIESAAQGPILVELERLYATTPVRAWGILLARTDELRRLEPRRDALLAHLGFSGILSNEPLRAPPGASRAIGEGFALTELPKVEGLGALALPWREALELVSDEPRAYFLARGEFLRRGAPLPLRAHGAARPTTLEPASPEARVSAWETSDGQGIELRVDPGSGPGPIPVLVRASYHPGWQAADARGAPLPIYEVAPHLMMVFADGDVRLRFGLSALERRAQLASLVGLALVIMVTLAERRRRALPTARGA